MTPGRWIRRLTAALLAGALAAPLLAAAPGPARAGYQGTVASNETAFEPPCLAFDDPYPEKMLKAATAAFTALGYTTRAYTGAAFTRAAYLSRTAGDWGTYVHSHGDSYWHAADARRYSGFREDSGDCSQAVVYSKDIAAKRDGRQANLVVMSTCHLGEDDATMPAAFGISKKKFPEGAWGGPEFYVGYLGAAWDNDEWTFEVAFWDAIGPGYGAGEAFDVAAARVFTHPFDANWWGSYVYTGRAGSLPSGCDLCL
jgi:hypothetical protein